MKKIYKYLSVLIFNFVLVTSHVYAASLNVSSTSNTVTVGNTITITISGNSLTGKVSIKSSDTSIATVSESSTWIENNTKYITVTTKKAGKVSFIITASDCADSNTGNSFSDTKQIYLTVNQKQTPNYNQGSSSSKNNNSSSNTTTKPKSSNSYLSSISIDGLELDKKFDKEVLEYTVKVPAGKEKIKINAQLDDSRASVKGTGEVSVSPGVNTIELIVTAENGSKKTYKITAEVEEIKPITVTVDNKEYTVIRNKSDLPKISEYYEEKEVTIGTDSVAGYYNKATKYTLVALKDSSGNINYYIYKDNKFTLYKEYVFNGTVLQILPKEVSGAKLSSFIYNDDKISSYQAVKMDLIKNTYALDNNDITGNQFYLFYAKNIETGKIYLYQYDALEKTVQRYNTEILDIYKNQSNKYYTIILGTILLLGIVIITFSIIIINNNKKSKKKYKLQKESKEVKKIKKDDDLAIKEDIKEN